MYFEDKKSKMVVRPVHPSLLPVSDGENEDDINTKKKNDLIKSRIAFGIKEKLLNAQIDLNNQAFKDFKPPKKGETSGLNSS